MPTTQTQYGRVTEALRDRILKGGLTPGQQVPSERVLAKRYEVSRVTVRRALALLAAEGLVRRRQGLGTFVSPHPSRRIPLHIDYTGSMRRHAPKLVRQALTVARRPAPETVAARLELNEGAEVLHAERLDRLGKGAVAWDEAWITPEFARGVGERVLAHVDFVEQWTRAAEFALGSCRQAIEARAADARDAEYLGLDVGAPVLVSTEVYVAATGRPAGLFVSRYHPEQICIASTYDWQRDVVGGREE